MLHQSPLLRHSRKRVGGVLLCLTTFAAGAAALPLIPAVSFESTVFQPWLWLFAMFGLACFGVMFNNLHQRAKEAELERPFANLFDNLPVPMAIMRGRDLVFVSANQEFQRLTRTALADIVGKTHQQVGIEVAPAEQQRFYACILAQPRVRDYELTVRFFAHELVLLISSEHLTFNGELCLLGSFQNITARKQAEERFAKVFHANPISMTIIRCRDQRIVETNPSTLQLTGLTLAEMQGKTLRELQVGIAPETWQEISARLAATGKLSDYEFNVTYQNRERILLAGAEYIEFNGEPCLLWSQQDITERKLAEERFIKAFNANPLPMCISRFDAYEILYANEIFLRRTRRSLTEVIGKVPAEIGFDIDLTKLNAITEMLQTAGSVQDYELQTSYQGQTLYYLANAESLSLGGERCVLWSFQDITARKLAEERFAKAFNANPNPTALISLSDQKFVQINQAWSQISGIAREQVVGHTTQEVNLWAQPEQRLEFYRLLEETGRVRDFEAEAMLPNGQRQTFQLYAEPFNLNGQPHLLTCSFDITARKRAEAALQESQARLRMALDAAALGIWEHDLQTNLVYLDERAQRHFGLASELPVAEFMRRIHLDDLEASRQVMRNVLDSRSESPQRSLEFRWLHPDGTTRWLRFDIHVSFAGQGTARHAVRSVGTSLDITERKQAEENLRKSELRYRSLVEDQTEFVTRWLPDGTRTFVNDSYCRFFGVTREEALRTSWFPAIIDAAGQAELAKMAALTPDQPLHQAEHFRHVEGRPTWTQWSNRAIFNEAGQIIEYQSVGRDITERKQADETLRASELRYRRLVEDQPDFLVRWTPDGTRTFVNDSYCRFFGLEREKALGTSWFSLVGLGGYNSVRQKLAGISPANPIVEWEHQYPDPNGSRAWIHWINRAFFDETGQLTEFQSVGRDITKRKQAEEIAQRWQSVFDRTALALALTNVADNTYLDVNEAYARTRGYTRAELIGQTVHMIYPPDEFEHIARTMEEVDRTGHAVFETVHQRKDGSRFPLLMELTSIHDAQGRPHSRISYTLDITDRKQAEAALQASEAKFRALAETSQMSVLFYDDQGFSYVNPAAEQLYGYTREEFSQLTWRNLVHPEAKQLAEERRHTRLEKGQSTTRNEIKVITKSGAALWVDYSIGAMEFEGQHYEIATVFDITKRKHAEEELRASEAKFRTLAESSQIGISIYDEAGFIYVNPAIERLYGYTRAELTHLTWRDLVHPDARQEAEDRYQSRQKIGQDYAQGEIELMNKAGEPIWVNYSIGTMKLAGQRYTIATSFDITERKRAEAELRISEERFAAAFNASPDAMAITTFEAGRYVLVNDAWVKTFGISREAALGQQFQNLKVWVDKTQSNYVFRQVRATGSVVDYEVAGQTAAGQTGTLLITAKLIKLGAATFVLSVSKDITERKRVEVELQNSQAQLRNLAGRLQAVREEERAAIAREIHDELGQALTGIKMDLKWLEQLLPPEAAPARERLTSVYSLIGNTVQSVRQLATSLRPGVLDDFGLVAALEWQARDFTTRTGIPCDFAELPEELPLNPAYATALFRIFQETLTNVARHAEATRINVRLRYESQSLHMQIHDNGKGISADAIKHSRSLGLVGMRERALLLDGKFSIEGGPERGTTINVQIPLAANSQAGPQAQEKIYDSHLDR